MTIQVSWDIKLINEYMFWTAGDTVFTANLVNVDMIIFKILLKTNPS